MLVRASTTPISSAGAASLSLMISAVNGSALNGRRLARADRFRALPAAADEAPVARPRELVPGRQPARAPDQHQQQDGREQQLREAGVPAVERARLDPPQE